MIKAKMHSHIEYVMKRVYCLGCVRNVAAAQNINGPEPTSALPNCLTYRQVAGAGIGAGSAPARRVPVLFSTNRGLYLRVAQPQATLQNVATAAGHQYDISFCDLERWSTNRANVVSLEDTLSILQPQQQEHQQEHQQQQQQAPSSQQACAWNNFAVYNVQR